MGRGKKIEIQVERDHYFNRSYDTKARFVSYWHQIKEALELNPVRLLEVGIGNGFVSRYLRDKGVRTATLDVDPRLGPDVVGSVTAMPFANASFDVVTCYEVLEHLPYEAFPAALGEIRRVAQAHALLSIPDVTTVYRLDIELPRLRPIRRLVPHPLPRPARHVYDGKHYWEIGKAGFPLARVAEDIRKAGFGIRETYRVFEFYYHRFFLLEKEPR